MVDFNSIERLRNKSERGNIKYTPKPFIAVKEFYVWMETIEVYEIPSSTCEGRYLEYSYRSLLADIAKDIYTDSGLPEER